MQNDMHTDRISSISTNASQTLLLTSSADKSARVWDPVSGGLLQTLRPPIGTGRIGRLHSGAISPDGRFAAIGGHDKEGGLYVFSLENGLIVARIGLLNEPVNLIEFSPDGRYLAFSLITNCVHILDCRDWSYVKKLWVDPGRLGGMSFAPDGRLAITNLTPKLWVFNRDFGESAELDLPATSQPYRICFSPDGSKLAISYANTFCLEVRDASTLKLLCRPSSTGMVGERYRYLVASFSADSKILYAGGSCQEDTLPGSRYTIRAWQDQGKGTCQDYGVSSNSITDLRPRLQGGVFFSGMAPDWGIFDPASKNTVHQAPEINEFTLWDRQHLRVNESGGEVGFASWGKKAREFVLPDRMLYQRSSSHPFFADKVDAIRVSDWDQSFQPQINGIKATFLDNLEQNICVDIARTTKRLLFGSIWGLYCLDANGGYYWGVSTPAMVMAVKASGNGKVAVTALSDGTIRWYRMEDGILLMTLFAHREENRWVLYTPDGYYDCSPDAETMIGWQINQGYDKPSLFYPVGKFRDQFYRPDVLKTLLTTLDLQASLSQANQAMGKPISAADIKSALPPRLEIISPADGSGFNTPEITVSYRLIDPANNKLRAIKVKVDNFSMLSIKNPQITDGVGSFTLKLKPRDTRIKLTAEGGKGIDVREISLRWTGDQARTIPLPKPRLFVLAVGVAAYQNNIKQLSYPSKDARDFITAIETHVKPMYDSLAVRVITDAGATLKNVIDGLDWAASVCKPTDVVMIFLSGHGANDGKGMYHFLPVDARADNIEQSCLSYSVLEAKLRSISGKVILFTDTCHAGGIYDDPRFQLPDNTGFVNRISSDEVGVVVYASSTASQLSQEKASWDNGAFTKALVEGLQGRADLLSEHKVTFKGLDYYISRRVESLTQKTQQPVTMPAKIPDFDLIRLSEEE